jgi:hypothetical protein
MGSGPWRRSGVVVALLSLLAACGDDGGTGPRCTTDAECDGGRCADGRCVAVDSGAMDSTVRDTATDTSIPGCGPTRPCASDERCVDGTCVRDLCRAAGVSCSGDDLCRTSCVPTSDPCIGVTCDVGETCIGGRCIAGCYRNPCEGVTCHPELRHCDPTTGTCVQTRHCDRPCPDGTVCHASCVPPDPCADVTCPDGQRCSGGTCVDDPCAGVDCPGDTEVCIDGSCFDTCECSPGCASGERCVFGECECAPICDPTERCGEDDGCGGTCPGVCTGENFFCELNATRHGCGCVASCWRPGTVCGDPTGCSSGSTCLGACPSGQRCVGEVTEMRMCECAPDCAGAECGAPDGCGGACPIGECPGGEFCADGVCCEQTCPADAACGDPDGCGGGCMGSCPAGESCTPDREGVYGCACTDRCASDAACGDPSPCGGGSCPGSCPAGESCERVGGGYACVCTPDCSGAACGGPDGCGGVCRIGRCPGGEFCGDGVCQPAACEPACGCGEICAGTTCQPLCLAGETLCGCDSCCVPGEACVDGACVPDLI